MELLVQKSFAVWFFTQGLQYCNGLTLRQTLQLSAGFTLITNISTIGSSFKCRFEP